MHTGMLWFDNDAKKTIQQKVKNAADYYFKKYGKQPDLSLVHPSMMPEGIRMLEVGKLTVRAYRPVLPGHIWIGIEDK